MNERTFLIALLLMCLGTASVGISRALVNLDMIGYVLGILCLALASLSLAWAITKPKP